MTERVCWGFSLALALLALSCASEPADVPQVAANSVRDSSGIQIVESFHPVWKSDEAWTVSPVPTISLGTAAGPDTSQLFTTIVGVTRFPDGRIAVALLGSSEIRFFDALGTYINSTGRVGRGPGEFTELGFMARFRGDSILAYDRARNTLVVFDHAGKFARTSKVTLSQEVAAAPRGVFDDGAILASWGIESAPAPGEKSAPRESRSRFATVTQDGELQTELGRLLTSRNRIVHSRARGFEDEIDTLFMTVPQIHIAVNGSSYYYGDATRFEILVRTSMGELRRIIRVSLANDAIPNSEKTDTATVAVQTSSGRQAVSRRVLKPRNIVWPDDYPAFSDIEPDALGNLWVKRDSQEGAAGITQRWFVFDSSAVLLGTVQMPGGVNIDEIGDDYVLGRARDSLGVESVKVFALTKRKRN